MSPALKIYAHSYLLEPLDICLQMAIRSEATQQTTANQRRLYYARRECAIEKQKGITMSEKRDLIIDRLSKRLDPNILKMLKEHQLEGIEFMQTKHICINADEMGLGKTAQALCSLNKRGLVICPAGLKSNWEAECRRFRPDLTPIILQGRGAGVMAPSDGQLIITNVEILPDWLKPFPTRCGYKYSDKSPAAKQARKQYKHDKKIHQKMLDAYKQTFKYTTLIIDESHLYSNEKATRNYQVTQLASLCGRVWAMSGTPMDMGSPAKLMDMLNAIGIFNYLFRSQHEFLSMAGLKFVKKYNYSGYEQENPPSPELNKRLQKIMIRRKKEFVLDLPDKMFEYVTVKVTDKEINDELQRLSDKYKDQVLKLNQLPSLEDFSSVRSALSSSRKDAVLDIVKVYEAANTPLIVFSAHRNGLDCLKGRDGWAYIDGATSKKKKHEIVSNQHKYKGLALTLVANHAGLNLTHFSDMLYVDLSWNVAINNQSYDRCHRMGQKNNVRIMIMTSDNAVDRRINEKLSIAQNNIDKVIDLNLKGENYDYGY